MLVGNYSHKLDGKGRTVLPARFRGELGTTVIATIGFDRCIALYSSAQWEEFVGKIKALPSFKKKTRDICFLLNSMATEQEIDAAGRILLSNKQKEYAGLEQDITIIGQEDHVEIWDTKTFEENRKSLLSEFGNLAEELEDI